MFVKKEVLEKANTPYKLVKVDVSKEDVLHPAELLEFGTAAKHFLKPSHLPEEKKRKFKKSCCVMLVSIAQKLQE